MNTHIFACFSKKMYYYLGMKKAVLLGLFFGLAFSVQAQNYKLRTVLVYSFTRYIHWPEGYDQGSFDIRVLGDSPFFEELENMAKIKKAPGDRPITVKKIQDLTEVTKCNILVVPSAKSTQLAEVLKAIGDQAVLVVTEEPGLCTEGSDINFVDKDGRLAFELNQAALNKRKLKVSTELTKLAILI